MKILLAFVLASVSPPESVGAACVADRPHHPPSQRPDPEWSRRCGPATTAASPTSSSLTRTTARLARSCLRPRRWPRPRRSCSCSGGSPTPLKEMDESLIIIRFGDSFPRFLPAAHARSGGRSRSYFVSHSVSQQSKPK